MSRKPKDEVAASSTVTLRLTPDDRERIERQIRARAAELPERSISALLRRLIREGEDTILLRLGDDDRATLDRLVSERSEELSRLGVHEAQVTTSSVLIGLIRDAARTRGILPSSVSSASSPATAVPEPTKGEAPKKRIAAADPGHVHTAYLAALGDGIRQADLTRKTGIDSGQLSRFKRDGSGLSTERLARLAEALETKG